MALGREILDRPEGFADRCLGAANVTHESLCLSPALGEAGADSEPEAAGLQLECL